MKFSKWLLPVFYVFLYLIPLNLRPLWIPDETRYAEISREMIASGNWVVPHLMGLRYFEKPIAGYWFNSISQLLFGDNPFSVRFAQAFFTGLSALLIYWFAMRLWRERRRAVAAVLIYLSSLLVLGVGTDAVLDSIFTFWMNLAMVTFYLAYSAETVRGRVWSYVALGAACGMGFLTKGFIALAVPVVVAVPFMLHQRRFMELVKYGPIAIVVATLISLPWSLRINTLDPDFWRYFFWVQHIKRFAGNHAQHAQPFWYYLPMLIIGILPWTGLVPTALRRGWRATGWRRDYLYLLGWFVLPILFFSISKGKLPTYILPSFAALAMLIAWGVVERLKDDDKAPSFRINGVINLLFGLGACAALLLLRLRVSNGQPLYGIDETRELAIAMVIFGAWGVIGLLQVIRPKRLWLLSSFCLFPLMYLFPSALPSSVVYSKLPETFIQHHRQVFDNAGTILSNDVGLATSIGWELKRTDVDMFDGKGELEYGLSYPDTQSRYVSKQGFATWLPGALKKGPVVLFLRAEHQRDLQAMPKPSEEITKGKFTLLIYRPESPAS